MTTATAPPAHTFQLASIASPIGQIHLAFEGDTLRALRFDGMQSTVAALLARQFGADARITKSREPHPAIDALRGYFEGDLGALDAIDVDPAGTPFQQSVWRELRRIPVGRTASYAEIAARIGAPKSFRAVARANATNPIGIVIPCHRVIGANGDLRGYGGGIDRKIWLLDHERRAHQPALTTDS
jgi:methylated-DNA-[protein]-cysteine S-methyltransferase